MKMNLTLFKIKAQNNPIKYTLFVTLLLCSNYFALGQIQTNPTNEELNEMQLEGLRVLRKANKSKLEDCDNEKAERLYRESIFRNPKSFEANYNLANSLFDRNGYVESQHYFEKAAKNAKNKIEKHRAYHNKGNAHMLASEFDKAIEAYKEALRNDPTNENSRYNLAMAQAMNEQQQQQDQQQQDQQNQDQDQQDQENKDQQDQEQSTNNNDQKDKEKQKDKENQEEDKEEQDDSDNEKDKEQEKEDKDENPDQDQEDKDEEKDQKDPKNPESDQQENPSSDPEPKQIEGQLSPEQVKNILEAMNQKEKDLQERKNASKEGGVIHSEKDW